MMIYFEPYLFKSFIQTIIYMEAIYLIIICFYVIILTNIIKIDLYGNYTDQINTKVTAIGYPGEYKYYMYYSDGTVLHAVEHYINIDCDATKGESGGAIIDTASVYLVGIISHERGSYNTAVRLNEDLCSRIIAHQNEVG